MSGTRLRFDEYEVDLATRELRRYGRRVQIQHKPFRALELMLRRAGEFVTREELVHFLWPDSHVSFERSLNTAVNSLRQALGDSPRHSRFIETRPGLGYRFCRPVEHVRVPVANDINKPGDSYEDYAKGRYFLDRTSEEDTHKAIAFFKSSNADGVSKALAHAGLADAYCQLALLGVMRPSKVAVEARRCAQIALACGAGVAPAHVAVGRVNMIFDWDWQAVRNAVNTALKLDDMSASAHTLAASLLCTLGQHEEACRACLRALAADPLSFAANLQFATCLYAEGELERSVEQCWKVLTLAPQFAPAQIILGMAYERLGMQEEALIEFQNARCSETFNPVALAGMGCLYAAMHLEREAEATGQQLSRIASSRYVSPFCFALIYAARGECDRCFSCLEECVRERDPALLLLPFDSRFDGLRKFEGFQAVTATLTCRLAQLASTATHA